MSLRTKEGEAVYAQAKQGGLLNVVPDASGVSVFDLEHLEIIQEYTYWVCVPNRFPYDRFAVRNDMLIPKRPFQDIADATQDELLEFVSIKSQESDKDTYDSILENLHTNRSIPGHFHVHLIKWKKTDNFICD